jgi:hypothetical protein
MILTSHSRLGLPSDMFPYVTARNRFMWLRICTCYTETTWNDFATSIFTKCTAPCYACYLFNDAASSLGYSADRGQVNSFIYIRRGAGIMDSRARQLRITAIQRKTVGSSVNNEFGTKWSWLNLRFVTREFSRKKKIQRSFQDSQCSTWNLNPEPPRTGSINVTCVNTAFGENLYPTGKETLVRPSRSMGIVSWECNQCDSQAGYLTVLTVHTGA